MISLYQTACLSENPFKSIASGCGQMLFEELHNAYHLANADLILLTISSNLEIRIILFYTNYEVVIALFQSYPNFSYSPIYLVKLKISE